jgi:hypothetical protein
LRSLSRHGIPRAAAPSIPAEAGTDIPDASTFLRRPPGVKGAARRYAMAYGHP